MNNFIRHCSITHNFKMDEIFRLRREKYESKDPILILKQKPKPSYNYDSRKETLNWIKRCSRMIVIREQMTQDEKKEYIEKMKRIQLEDLDHFEPRELNQIFMIDLFKYSNSLEVLNKACEKNSSNIHPSMIKELILKPNVPESFLMELLEKLIEHNITNQEFNDSDDTKKKSISCTLNTMMNVGIVESTKFPNAKNYLMEKFYSNQSTMISFEQLKMICENTIVDPDKLKILVQKCSNVYASSKYLNFQSERKNLDLIKNIIREKELEYDCKINIGLYNL